LPSSALLFLRASAAFPRCPFTTVPFATDFSVVSDIHFSSQSGCTDHYDVAIVNYALAFSLPVQQSPPALAALRAKPPIQKKTPPPNPTRFAATILPFSLYGFHHLPRLLFEEMIDLKCSSPQFFLRFAIVRERFCIALA